jgi:hypothetical protein
MTHNALSKSMGNIPMWLIQAIVGLFLTGLVTGATWLSTNTWKHEVRITNVETKVDGVKSDIVEIKDGQKEINRKLDRLIERRGR